MNARFFASVLAALAMLGSLPFWWWLQQRQHGATTSAANGATSPGQPDGPSESTPPPAAEAVRSPADTAAVAQATPSTSEPARPEKPQPELITGPDPGRSPLADRLNAPDGSVELDLAIVHTVLTNYVLEFGANPVGANREITAQLSGRNSRRHAPLPADLSAISESGELVDRWGTPFFFHALSAREMEIRSAGPDRELYTTDDALWTPGP